MEPISKNDEKVVELLSKLKNSNGGYPSDLLASRRRMYLKQVANVGLGIGIGTGLKNSVKGGNGAGATTTITSKILETALVAAIAIEASTAAYLYRDKITDLVKSYTTSSNVQVTAPASVDTSSKNPNVAEILVTPSITMPSVTPSGTPSGTPATTLAGNNNNNANNNNGTSVNANSTPIPNGNNGNQYGLTPKPVRTKDNQNNNSGDGSGDSGGNGGGNGNGNGNKP